VALALAEGVSSYILNRSDAVIVSSGQQREYSLYVPSRYDGSRPTPLVISMHGAGGWPAIQRETSQWNALAEREGFIVAYPSGLTRRGPRVWRQGGESGLRDVRFIADLIDTLKAAYDIDSTRIYANGLSNGGAMAFVLSCALSDRIAAVGMVAPAHLQPWESCTEHRPMPMIAFHGTADRLVPYSGGTTWVARKAFPDVQTWTAKWARRNRCAPTPVDSAVGTDVIRRAYTNCAERADVVLYTLLGGGHTWPGGKPLPEWFVGRTSRSIDATRQMWAFFREHHR
jgi:polyhydroxybutyrate depolymerase